MSKHDLNRRCELCDLKRAELEREEILLRLERGINTIERGKKEVNKALHDLKSCR